MVSLPNPFNQTKSGEPLRRKQAELRIKGLKPKVQAHAMGPILASKIDWKELKDRLVREEDFTAAVFAEMEERKFYNPLLLYFLQSEHRWIFDHYGRASYSKIIVVGACDCLQSDGLTGLHQWLEICYDDKFKKMIEFQSGNLGMGFYHCRNFFQALFKELYREIGDIYWIKEFIHLFLSQEGYQVLVEGCYIDIADREKNQQVLLLQLAEYGKRREFLQPVFAGLKLLSSEPLAPFANSKDLDYPRIAAILAEQVRRGKSTNSIIDGLKKLHPTLALLSDPKKLVEMLELGLSLSDYEALPGQIAELKGYYKTKTRYLAKEFIHGLLINNPQSETPEGLSRWILAGKLALEHWKGKLTENKTTKIQAGQLLKRLAEDKEKIVYRFLGEIERQPEYQQSRLFSLMIKAVSGWGAFGVLTHLLKLLESGGFNLADKLPQRLHSEDLEERMELFFSLCLSLWLNSLLQNHELEPERYVPLINRGLNQCQESETRHLFFESLQQALAENVDLEEWLFYLLDKSRTEAGLLDALKLENFTRLDFAEVQPLLQQYMAALVGRLPLYQTKGFTPYTDGFNVFLPPFENRYSDSKIDLHENRNATLYLANLFHEVCYHILAGSFICDMKPTLEALENRNLGHMVLNILEDYRGREHFKAQEKNEPWLELVEQDEFLLIERGGWPVNWKMQFVSMLTAKGIHTKSPGDLNPRFLAREQDLLARPIILFSPTKLKIIHTTLGKAFDLILKSIESVKGKTVAHSLLLTPKLYQIISQILGEDYSPEAGDTKSTNGVNPDSMLVYLIDTGQSTDKAKRPKGFHFDFLPTSGVDVDLKATPDANGVVQWGYLAPKNQTREEREQQLKDNAKNLQGFQGQSNVPQAILVWQQNQKKDGLGVSEGPQSNMPTAGAPSFLGPTVLAQSYYEGQFDSKLRREIKDKQKVEFITLTQRSQEFELLKRLFRPVFDAMEEAIEELKLDRRMLEIESPDPGELIMENLIEGIIDPSSLPFIDLYEGSSESSEHDIPLLEVKILVDLSGSTSYTLTKSGMVVLDVEKICASVLFEAFKSLGSTVDLYFFYTAEVSMQADFDPKSKNPLTETTTKLFHCPDLDCMGEAQSNWSNRDGVAIRAITKKFTSEDHKLLVIITDGEPVYPHNSNEEALGDTMHAMYAAGQKGITIRYLNIGGISKTVLDGFSEVTKNPMVFTDPNEMINYAPTFVTDLIEELQGKSG